MNARRISAALTVACVAAASCAVPTLAQDVAVPGVQPADVAGSPPPGAILPAPDLECRLALVALASAREDIEAARHALADAEAQWSPLTWFALGALAAAAGVAIIYETGAR